ncbi:MULTISPECIES: GNAT family N-acetyltransferase [unclassified Pseudoalteromonas]|uniref:GNAT family N-acetyltransferase n=1 Tax=unclassified Pseudoalteromonas TaxID=194690 RepID=UPI00386803FA
MFKTLKLPRVTLRLITHKHAGGLFTILNNPLVAQFNDYKTPLSKDNIKQLIQDDISAYYEGEVIRLAIEHNIDTCFIGTCGLYKIGDKINSAFIGFELAPNYWQQGLMSEALVGFINTLPNTLQIYELFAEVNIKNICSHKLLTKLGFTPNFNADLLPSRIKTITSNNGELWYKKINVQGKQ